MRRPAFFFILFAVLTATVHASTQFQFSAPEYVTQEGAPGNSVSITVQRLGDSVGSVSVDLKTADDSATAGSDYSPVIATLVWGDGNASSKTINIPIIDDNIFELRERFSVTLSNPTGGAVIQDPNPVYVNINVNDTVSR